MVKEAIPEGAESDGVPFLPAAREALVRTGRWANWAGVFIGAGALVTVLSGALMFWQTEQTVKTLDNIHAAPGSRIAHLIAHEILGLRVGQAVVSGYLILGALLGAIMAWLALRFGRRLMHIRYGVSNKALTAAAQAQRTFWRTQGVFTICIMVLTFVMVMIVAIYLAVHIRH